MSVNEKMTAIADKIRAYTGDAEKIDLDGMVAGVDAAHDTGEDKGRLQWIRMRAKGSTSGFDDKYKVITAKDLEGVTKIHQGAFAIEGITSVTLPDSLLTIEKNAFCAFLFIKEIVIPNSVTTIGDYAFNNCWYLKNITIGASVQNIGAYAFNCDSDKVMTIYAETPPTIQSNTLYSMAEIWVPHGCGDVYKNATNWAVHADIIQEIE